MNPYMFVPHWLNVTIRSAPPICWQKNTNIKFALELWNSHTSLPTLVYTVVIASF